MPSSPRPQPAARPIAPAAQSQSDLGPARPLAPQDSAGQEAQDHRRQRGDEAQRRVAAAVVRERPLAGKQVQEPGVERPGQVAVLVPVRREAARMVRPVWRHADRGVSRTRRRGADRARTPPSSRRGSTPSAIHCTRAREERQHEQERVAQADLAERVLEREIGLRAAARPEEDPQEDQDQRSPEGVRRHPGFRLPPRQPAGQRERQGRPRPGTRTTAGSGRAASSRPTPRATGDGTTAPRTGCLARVVATSQRLEHLGHHQEHHQPAVGVDRGQPWRIGYGGESISGSAGSRVSHGGVDAPSAGSERSTQLARDQHRATRTIDGGRSDPIQLLVLPPQPINQRAMVGL